MSGNVCGCHQPQPQVHIWHQCANCGGGIPEGPVELVECPDCDGTGEVSMHVGGFEVNDCCERCGGNSYILARSYREGI